MAARDTRRRRICATADTKSSSVWNPSRQSAQQARADGMVVVAPDEAAKRADWIQVLTPDETQGELYEKLIKPYLHPGKGARRFARLQHSFQDDCSSERRGRGDDCAQEPGASGAARLYRRPRRAVADRDPAGCQRARPRTRAGLRARDRLDPRGRSADNFQGRNRERSVRRAGCALRRADVADQEGIRDSGRGRLRAGDRLLRVPARGEADRGPDLRRRTGAHALLDLEHGGIWRPDARRAGCRRCDARRR